MITSHSATALGRAVSIGRVNLHLGAPVTVVVQDVVVGNPDGFTADAEPFVRVSRLAVQLDVAAFLRRRAIVITSVELDRPTIHAVETADGRANYHLPFASSTPIGSLNILNGRARVSLARLHADFEASFATKHATESAEAPSIAGEARGTFAGEPLAARFAGSLPSDPRPSPSWPVEIAVENGPTQVSLKGRLPSPLSLHGAIVDVFIAGPDMVRLGPLTGVLFPATPPYELRGKLDSTGEAYQLTGAKGRLGRSELEGTMTVATRSGQRPEITADVLSSSVDLRDIVSLLSGNPGPPRTPGQTSSQQDQAAQSEQQALASPKVLPQAPLHPAKLNRVNLHLNFHAQRIQGASMPLDNLAFGMDVVDGSATIHQLSVGVGQGRIAGDIRLTPQTNDALQARADISFERVDVGRLLWASGGYQGSGALNGVVRVQGSGRSLADIAAGANGAVSLWMQGGDLSSLLVDLAGLRLGSALFSSLVGSRTTEVECFLADLPLQDGILSTRTLLLETADAVTQGRGTVDLGHERVEIRLRTQSRHLTVGVLPTPLLISGTLKAPRAAPDPATPAGRNGLAGALAILPTIQLGTAEAPPCRTLLREAQNR
ncbi:MAG TPA: AsmA family protein [Rhodopila sp.]|nr:AsmA family protein [Rhodopila sp.]